jgi:hypothetical protein
MNNESEYMWKEMVMSSFKVLLQYFPGMTEERGEVLKIIGKKVKGKAIPVTGRGGPYGCETWRLPHFLDNRLTDGGRVVSLTHRPPFTP